LITNTVIISPATHSLPFRAFLFPKTKYDRLQRVFEKQKWWSFQASGFDVNESALNKKLKPFQKWCVKDCTKERKVRIFRGLRVG
jgi:hypothetical protein